MAIIENQTQAVWRSALHTTLACSIVAITTLYGPKSVRQIMPYPSFSYMTTVLIVADAKVGDTLRGAWHVLYATLQVMLLSVLSLWLVGPDRFTPGLAATAVAVCSFIVAVPDSTRLMSKRIAFGQIVIVYVGTVVQGAKTPVVMHPVHVALSTALGAFACVVALLFPYPRLAWCQVQRICREYAENAADRLNLYTNAFSSDNSSAASELISLAKSYSKIGDNLLQTLKSKEEGMLWERPDIRFRRPNYMNLSETLHETELPFRGMEMALESCSSFPIRILDEEHRHKLTTMKEFITQKLNQTKCMDAEETKESDSPEDSLHTLKKIPFWPQDLPPLFFLFCMDLLRRDNNYNPLTKEDQNPKFNSNGTFVAIWRRLRPSNESLLFGLKCSVSLGFAVLFGLLYDTKNAYWSGLTIAISFVTGRQPTFTIANARIQGTAIGSVYGVLTCFIFKANLHELRLLPVLPWVVFTTFLRHSRMYGQSGGDTALIGALLILGRTNYTTPTEFAIARLTEASIGLICFVAAEVLFRPTRAATLARTELSRTFEKLGECISSFPEKEKMVELNCHIAAYETYTREAELEPNFWFHPFPASCYLEVLEKLTQVADLLWFLTSAIDSLTQICPEIPLSDELEQFKEKVVASLKCLEKVVSVQSLLKLEKELLKKKKQKNIIVHADDDDIELGKLSISAASLLCVTKEEAEKVSTSFLWQSGEVIDQMVYDEEVKSRVVLCLGGIGFCIDKLMRETIAIEETVKEVIQRQNPLCRVNLSEISCKVDALRST